MQASELQQQMTQPVILCQQDVLPGDRRIALGHRRQSAAHALQWRSAGSAGRCFGESSRNESYAATDGLRTLWSEHASSPARRTKAFRNIPSAGADGIFFEVIQVLTHDIPSTAGHSA